MDARRDVRAWAFGREGKEGDKTARRIGTLLNDTDVGYGGKQMS